MKTIKFFSIATLAGILCALSLQAQPSASTAVQQQQSIPQAMPNLMPGTNAPELYSDEDADVGPQHILSLSPRRTMFEVSADSEYLWTDNALLQPNGGVESTIFVNTISAAYVPTPYRLGNGRFAPSIGISSQWYNYGLGGHNLSTNDFNVQTISLGAKYLFSGNWMAFGEFDYNRFVGQRDYREFYHDFTPVIGLENLMRVGDYAVLATTLKGDIHDSWAGTPLADDSEDRGDLSAAFSLSYLVNPKLVMQPYYRFQYTHYAWNVLHTGNRNDFLHSIGVSAAYYFLPNLSLRLFVNQDVRTSSDTNAKYHAVSAGGDLTYSIQF